MDFRAQPLHVTTQIAAHSRTKCQLILLIIRLWFQKTHIRSTTNELHFAAPGRDSQQVTWTRHSIWHQTIGVFLFYRYINRPIHLGGFANQPGAIWPKLPIRGFRIIPSTCVHAWTFCFVHQKDIAHAKFPTSVVRQKISRTRIYRPFSTATLPWSKRVALLSECISCSSQL